MNVDNNKRNEGSKDKNLALKVTESDESDLDDEYIALIRRNSKKLFKKGMNYVKKKSLNKDKSTENIQNGGCYKCGKTYHHQVKDCPMWDVEWIK